METATYWIFRINGISRLVELHSCWMALLTNGMFESFFLPDACSVLPPRGEVGQVGVRAVRPGVSKAVHTFESKGMSVCPPVTQS